MNVTLTKENFKDKEGLLLRLRKLNLTDTSLINLLFAQIFVLYIHKYTVKKMH